jgi:uncharacterized protein (TIGR02217 family)
VLSSVVVSDNGVLVSPSAYSVSRPGGVVTFNTPPSNGHALKAGFLFDVNVRFEADDSLETAMRALRVAGFADMVLLEVTLC